MSSCRASAILAHAVDDAEVDRLRLAAHVGRDLVERNVERDRRREAVDVLGLAERVDEELVLREVREHAQLDLRVVRGDEDEALRRDERGADLLAELAADRDVLEVRLDRREAARRRDGLREARVDAPGLRVDVRAAARRCTCP